jgi:XTP/dITP diphosphohydrolase
MKIAFATTNRAKVMSLSDAFQGTGVELEQVAIELPEPRSDEVEEIANKKVQYAFEQLKRPVIALDAGFFVDSLNGFPKAFVNFALGTIGLEGIQKLVEGKQRVCEFRHALAYQDERLSEPKVFVDHVRGTLAPAPRGTSRPRDWSVLSQVFVPEGLEKTLSEMDDAEYEDWRDTKLWHDSYRKAFVEWIGRHLGQVK